MHLRRAHSTPMQRLRCLAGLHVWGPWRSHGPCEPACTADHQLRGCRWCPKMRHRFRPQTEAFADIRKKEIT